MPCPVPLARGGFFGWRVSAQVGMLMPPEQIFFGGGRGGRIPA